MNTKKCFLTIVIFTILILGYSGYIAINQNTEYTAYGLTYINAQSLITKNPKEAISQIEYLQLKDPNNYIFHLDKAKAYINLKDEQNAKIECEKALKERPVLDEDEKFMSIYGQILYLNEEYKQAKKVLTKVKEMGIPEEYEDDVNKMLKVLK